MKKVGVFLVVFVILFSLSAFVGCSDGGEDRTLYEIDCEYFDTGTLSVKETVTFSAQKSGMKEAIFNVYPLALEVGEGATSADENDGIVRFIGVKSCGRQAEYKRVGKNSLSVTLPREHQKGERIKIDLNMSMTFPKGDKRFAVNDKTVNVGNFFPVLAVYDERTGGYTLCDHIDYGDPFVSEVADYEVTMTVPSTYTVAASGYATSLDVGETKTKYSYRVKSVRDFAFALSDKYEVRNEKWGNKQIIYYYYADIEPEKTIETAVKSLEFFSEKFGEYPYDTYCVAQTAFSAGGMEYPLMCFLSDKLTGDDYLYALVHETAHQWWYGVVGNDQINESYLDESLAEYSAYIFFDEHDEYGIDCDAMIKGAASAVNVCESAVMANDKSFVPAVRNSLENFKSEYVYVNMVYNKGLVMLKAAENVVGRKNTVKALAAYYGKNRYRIANTDDFLACLGQAAPVVRSFLDGKTKVFI